MRSTALAAGWRLGGRGFGLLVFLAVAGCGPAHGRVSGRVLFDGEPLSGGWVTFRPADPRQNAVPAHIGADGSYSAVLPVGLVQVSVDNRELEQRPHTARPAPPPDLSPEALKALDNPPARTPAAGESEPEKQSGNYVKIPKRYYAAETSGLEFTVAVGEQQHDIELQR